MKKTFKTLLGMILAVSMLACLGTAAFAENAYSVLPLNSEDYDIAEIYFVESSLTDQTVNPATVAAYTQEELDAVLASDAIIAPNGAVIGMLAKSTGDMFWYDTENAAAILSHDDPLTLDAETGILSTAEGVAVAQPMVSAYVVLPLDSEDYDISNVIFASSMLTEETTNPATVAAYTQEELDAVLASDAIIAPNGAVIGMQAKSTGDMFWYDTENAAAILSHDDPLTLDAETGILSTAEGVAVAQPIVTAYVVLALDSDDYDISNVIFASSMLTEETTNPATVAAYTQEEIDTIEASTAIAAPAGAVVGMQAKSTGDMFWYDAENAAAILSHDDPLTLDAETGILSTADGVAVAQPIVTAYVVLALDSEDYDISCVIFASSMLTEETTNPATVAAYTQEELDDIKASFVVVGPSGAVIGMQANSTPVIFWYDAENAAAILSHDDPLTLNAETGVLSTADGTVVATPIA